MSQWTEVQPRIWETPVELCSEVATVRVEPEAGATWAMRICWNGSARIYIGGYPTAAHARQALAQGVLMAIAERSRSFSRRA